MGFTFAGELSGSRKLYLKSKDKSPAVIQAKEETGQKCRCHLREVLVDGPVCQRRERPFPLR